jgi:Flp pilus assembly secretin CpaC
MDEPFKPEADTVSMENIIFWWCLALAAAICLGGCGDFFATKPTELESRAILSELSQVRQSPHIDNPLPEIYQGPTKRITTKNGVKILYFTKHHAVNQLAQLVSEQFATKPVGNEGRKEVIPGYVVTGNPATNQLIIQSPDDTSADRIQEFLGMIDVPPIQVNIDCLILERFGDETMDWETSIMIDNFLGQEITLGADRGTFDGTGVLTSLNPAFPGASLRESLRSTFGLDFGYWIDKGVPGHQVRAVVDLLISRGYLKILLNPTLETINGQEATVTIKDYAPIEKIVSKEGFDEPFGLTDYVWVEDTLTVTPSVFADGSIGLKTSIKIGSKSKPEGVVQTSIITERSIKVDENRITPGESLIIGGMRKSEKRSVVRGVPFFKDIPIIGVLFSSKDFEEKATEIIFILTPSISSGSVEHAKIVEQIRQKHALVKPKGGLGEAFTDPFGTGAYTDVIERKAVEAEIARLRAEIEAAAMSKDMEEMRDALSAARLQLDAERLRVEKAQAEKDKAIAEAGMAAAQAQNAREAADKVKAEAQAAKFVADEAEKKAQTLLKQAESDKAKAQKAADELAKVRAEAEAVKAAAIAEAEQSAQAAEPEVGVEAERDLPPAKTESPDEVPN